MAFALLLHLVKPATPFLRWRHLVLVFAHLMSGFGRTEAGTAAHQRSPLVVDHAEYFRCNAYPSVASTTPCGFRLTVGIYLATTTLDLGALVQVQYRLFCTVQPQRPGTNPGHDSPVASSLAWTILSSCLALSGLPATPSEHEALPVFLALSRRR